MTTQELTMLMASPRLRRGMSLPRRAALTLAEVLARFALHRSEPSGRSARDDAERRREQHRDRWFDLTPLR